ncbi:hypothetical protein [Xenorhabdus sp. SGI240]|uniref:hypothetical protein n=1 Tax=Xenorhabdus sp. SGI240 TaxID=3158262 RepID=UPI0032B729D4
MKREGNTHYNYRHTFKFHFISGGGIARFEAITTYPDGSSTDTGKITGVVDEILAKVIDILDP